MTLGRSASLNRQPIYIQPRSFADYLSCQKSYCLFLDIDGTLADFTLNPKDSIIPHSTLVLLEKIQKSGVKIAAVTGRGLAEAKQMLLPLSLPIAATHGLEIAFDGNDSHSEKNVSAVDSVELAEIRQAVIHSCSPFNDLSIEDKPYSVAIHFRKNPALSDTAYTIMVEALKSYPNWTLNSGKCVWEAVPKGVNKGSAILTLLKKMQSNEHFCPIFIGDDITDETGFVAVQNKVLKNFPQPITGLGIKVGREATHANYYVRNIHEVTVLLKSFLEFLEQRTAPADKTARYVI